MSNELCPKYGNLSVGPEENQYWIEVGVAFCRTLDSRTFTLDEYNLLSPVALHNLKHILKIHYHTLYDISRFMSACKLCAPVPHMTACVTSNLTEFCATARSLCPTGWLSIDPQFELVGSVETPKLEMFDDAFEQSVRRHHPWTPLFTTD